MKKNTYIEGVESIADQLNLIVLPLIPDAATKKTTRRALKDGRLPSEPKGKSSEPFMIHVNSMPSVDPACEWSGFDELSYETGWSVRSCKAFVASGRWPSDKLFGRFYFNPSSFADLRKRR